MTTTKEILRGLPYFAELPDDLLEAVCSASEQLDIEEGTDIISEGSASEEMYVLIEGEFTVTKRAGEKDVVLAKLGPGEVVGEIALLDMAPRTATVSAAMPSKVIRVPAESFERLLSDASVVRRMFQTVTGRLRGIEDTVRHEERMAALGRMAAQLMHELNNPAAAVGRSTRELQDVYDDLSEEAATLASALSGGIELSSPEPGGPMSPMERSEAEESLAEWLDDLGVEDAWALAPGLIHAGWNADLLEEQLEQAESDQVPHWARWIALRATAGQLIQEIGMAAGRVSELVRIVKEYSYLDQAPVQEIVPTAGIADTLVLLKHKLRDIEVITDFPDDLATVDAPGRDLNQVWTNLIDNAADAMEEGGSLTITARNGDEVVEITVADTGSGMAEDVADRVFDPFFTTKEPGKGTGLGLHTVHTIVTRIGGDITVESGPDGTAFKVVLPKAEVDKADS